MALAKRVDVADTAIRLNDQPDRDRVVGSSIVVKNVGLSDVYLGGSDVTPTTGLTLGTGDVISIDLGGKDALYAVTNTTSRVEVLIVGV